MHTVLVTLPVSKEQQQLFQSHAPNYLMIFSSFGRVTADQAAAATVIIGNLPADLLVYAKQLQWIQLYSSSATEYLDNISHDTLITSATGAYGPSVAEHLLTMLLAVMKQIPQYHTAQRNRTWMKPSPSQQVRDSTVLILGTGDIGRHFALMIQALGGRTIGVKRVGVASVQGCDEVHTVEHLDSLIPQADVIACTLPGSELTRSIIGSHQFALMKQGAIVLNVGRASLIDTHALCDALEAGRIQAAIDVCDEEPLPIDHRLWDVPNLLITPHIAGGLMVGATRDRVTALSLENLIRFRNGEQLHNLIDRQTGYKGK